MKIGLAIEQTAKAEQDLAERLWAAGERHKADHDVLHLTKTLAKLSEEHVEKLAPHAERYDASIERQVSKDAGRSRPLAATIEKGAELTGRRPEPALLLLRDLRDLHLRAAEASIDWVALGQGAQAAKDSDLLETVGACHAETLRTLKWTTYRIKTAAPQALTS